ncbi:methyltransferase [Rhodococcoides trifolii]|uniref:Methyltransferase n=1 Tax=Rhodococcoides trifolii TaxID=908250 RepID=A0A917LFL3_9NOCA|nr:methyltransferase [Rhodococcus trifolii]
MFDYDAELRLHNELLRAAAAVRPGDRVLDIGCGTGQTTREAAKLATTVLGVDVSAQMLERAIHLSEADLNNVTYLLADAQTHTFPESYFDLAISRFGVMFFADPTAAFTNIARALRPGARICFMVWQGYERNEWASSIHDAIGAPRSGGPDPFSLADPIATEQILTASGFVDVTFTEVDRPVYYGSDSSAALEAISGLWGVDDEHGRLRSTLAAHETDAGVHFGSRAWIIGGSLPDPLRH